MRVLVCGDDPSTTGGIARVMANFRNQLQDHPHQFGEFECVFIDPRGREHWTVVSTVRALARIVATVLRGVDVVHLNTASRGGTYRSMTVALVAFLRRTPYVIHLHAGGFIDYIDGLSKPLRFLLRVFFRSAAHVVTLTPGWYDYVIRMFDVAPEKVTTVLNGTEAPHAELLDVTEDRPTTFVYVGRLTEDKGVPVLLDAFHGLHDLCGARLLLLGTNADAPTRAALSAAPAGVETRGWVDHDEVLATIARARAMVLPSFGENMPMVVLEAMSVGTPVVATRIMAMPDILEDGVEGLLVEPGDAVELRRTLVHLCQDAEIAKELGRQGRNRWSQHYDSATMAGRLTEIWRQVRG